MTTLPRTLDLLHQGLSSGAHIGAQLSISLRGQPLANLALGNARLAADSLSHADLPMAPDTLMLWLSAGKPITAVAILMLVERGLLTLEDPVANYWPEFAANGKDAITLRHLLTHTSGIRALDSSYPFASWDQTLSKIAAMRIERDWIPGMKAGYHTHTSWYVLGELIRRITGTPIDAWVRENLFLPLAMKDSWMALPHEQHEAYGDRIGYLYDTTHAPPRPLKNHDSPEAAARPRPSASCRGPMRDLARFYEMLRRGGELDGVRILNPDTVHALTLRQRVGMFDLTFRQTIDWGLGIILNSSHYGPAIPYQFGPYASPDTFGHGGSQSSTGFCDPQHHLVVALLFNGCPGEAPHDRRLRTTLKALYEDLDLAPASPT
jgi:CubicO group peptidase (beta-lactamase class C family)